MTEKRYNGNENWETWNVSLWLSNEQELYHKAQEIVNDDWYSFESQMIDELEEYVKGLFDEKIIMDNVSLHRVNWYEVAEDFLYDLEYDLKDSEPKYIEIIEKRRAWLKEMK